MALYKFRIIIIIIIITAWPISLFRHIGFLQSASSRPIVCPSFFVVKLQKLRNFATYSAQIMTIAASYINLVNYTRTNSSYRRLTVTPLATGKIRTADLRNVLGYR